MMVQGGAVHLVGVGSHLEEATEYAAGTKLSQYRFNSAAAASRQLCRGSGVVRAGSNGSYVARFNRSSERCATMAGSSAGSAWRGISARQARAKPRCREAAGASWISRDELSSA